MKTHQPKQIALILLLVLAGHLVFAQPTVEFASGGGPATSGSTIAGQVINWSGNLNNPIGNTFTPYVPATTVTFSLSEQQYDLTPAQSTNTNDVSFGAVGSAGATMIVPAATYEQMNAIGGAAASDFSSSNAPGAAGTGISLTANYATEIFTSTLGLYNVNASTNSRYYMAALTITFSNPVTNPVIQVAGLGGTYNSLGFSTELELRTSGYTLTELSGRGLTVGTGDILNSATNPGATTGSGGGSGSIVVNGSNITQLVFRIYMRGNGGQAQWASGSNHPGDAWLIGVSTQSTNVTLPVKMSDLLATAENNTSLLQWNTTLEENSNYFNIEHSTDGVNWQTIATQKAAGNSHVTINYSYIDNAPAWGNNFYRVVEVDLDGTTSYTPVAELGFGAGAAAHLSYYPNPTHDRVTVNGLADGVYSVTVLSIDGKSVAQLAGFRSGESVDLSRYPAGIYILLILDSNGGRQVLKVQKA